MYSVIRKEKLVSAADSSPKDTKKATVLAQDWDKPYTVATLVVDGVSPKAEVHELDADVFRVLSGEGAFILGGALKNKERTAPHELVGDSIEGGERREVYPGDVIDIPPGVPHQFDVKGGRLELMIVKIRRATQ